MKKKITSDDIARLKAELKYDLKEIETIVATNKKGIERIKNGADDYLDYAALGYTIHNIYSLMENSFYRIAKFFENNLSKNTWHRDLMDRMKLDIEGVRPALLDDKTFILIDDLRSFRHLFRNLYARSIDSDKILLVQKKVPLAVDGYKKNIEKYMIFLQSLLKEIE